MKTFVEFCSSCPGFRSKIWNARGMTIAKVPNAQPSAHNSKPFYLWAPVAVPWGTKITTHKRMYTVVGGHFRTVRKW